MISWQEIILDDFMVGKVVFIRMFQPFFSHSVPNIFIYYIKGRCLCSPADWLNCDVIPRRAVTSFSPLPLARCAAGWSCAYCSAPLVSCCPWPAGRPAPPAGVWLLADATHFLPGDSRYPATKAVNSNRDLSRRVALVPVGMRVTVGVDLTRGCSWREPGRAPEKVKIETICSIKLFFLMNWRPSQNRPSQTVPSVVLGVVPTTSAGLPVHTQC